MKTLFHDKIDREYPVRDFVKYVWNFDENDHPDLRLKIRSFIPRPAAVDTYNDAPNGVLCYPHLAAITDALLTHLFPAPIVRAVQSNVIFVRDASARGGYTSFQPDWKWRNLQKLKNRPWEWLLLFAEVGRAKAAKAPSAKDVRPKNVQESTPKSRKRKSPDSKDDVVEPSPKRRKQATVSPQEAQTAKYLNEMLSHGIRSFASGFFIRNRDMHLWYGDRMGLVKSCVFNWQKEPALMALVFAAFGTANLMQLGISPFLEFSPTSPAFESYEGGHIVLPASEVVIGDDQERPSEDMVFKIDTTRRVWTDWGAVGRGTTIVPLEAIGVAAERLGTEALVAKMAWPHAHRTSEEKSIRIVRSKLQQKAPSYLRHIVDLKCFVTRNMAEMGLPRAFIGIELPEEDKRDFRLMVMKKYESLECIEGVGEFKTVFEHVVRAHHWVSTTSGVLHRDISTGNIMFYRDAEGHVVGMLCDWDLAGEQLSDTEYEEDDDRMFHVRLVPKEVPTTTTDAQDNVVLTIKQQDGTSQTIKVPGQAITEKRPPRPRYRTGTGPFIALDMLLDAEPPLHHYRHELESFFFLLSYVCAVFDPEKHEFGSFSAWERSNLADVATAKLAFYMNWNSFESTFDHTHKDFGSLVDEWVMPLWELFSSAARMRRDIDALVRSRDRHASKGVDGMVAELDVEIGLLMTAWRKTITYEAFMDCLGLPLLYPQIRHVLLAMSQSLQLCDKIHRDFPVEKFVRHVWNFEVKDHPTQGPKIKTFVPDPTAVRLYNQAPDGKSCYPHHAKITRALLTHLFSAPIVSPEQSTVVQDHSAVAREHMPSKLALTWNTKVWPQIRLWEWMPLYTEVMMERVTKVAGDEDFRRLLQGDDAAITPQQTCEKRKFSASDSDDDGRSPKRRKVLDLSSTETRAAMHLSEMLFQGIRSFASGFFVRNSKMQLWYADRMGLVQSCAFDWQLRPDLMALVYAAVGNANLGQLGIIPFLQFPPMSQTLKNYEGARIVLPANEAVIGDGQERLSENMVFKVDATRKVWVDLSVVGRGTTIVPVKAIGSAVERFGRESLVVKMAWPDAHCAAEERLICLVRVQLRQKAPSYLRHIVDLKCFVTRNMEEMGLPRAFMNIELAEDDRRDFRLMVLKKYEELECVEGVGEFKTVFEHVVRAHHWVLTTSGVLHRDISAGNIMFYRNAEEHVVGMLCDWDLAEEQPSDVEYEEEDHQMFHVHPVPKEGPTSTTYAQGNVVPTLKRDGTPQTMKGPGQPMPEERPSRPRCRTGTGPFIALDMLLEDEPPLHRYRHELESFFFLLSYVCAVFDPANHRFGPFSAWEQGSLDDIASAKTLFYASEKCFKSSFDHSHEDFRVLACEWVKPLWELFSDADRRRGDVAALVRSCDRHASQRKDGMVAKLDADIGLLMTAWRKMITYETFMDCLGLPLHLPTDPTCPSCDVPVS
ncbi:hypothetical protein B0H21DRAFT_825012 [Amylocystis lapponica]|nr:hypothetical protein B0H21DRAFT_825012 [Amylocystis lapponica]